MSGWRSPTFVALRVVLGLLLLAAAGLKVSGWILEPFAAPPLFSAPWLRLLTLDFEVILGLWLVAGVYRIASWLIVTLTFFCFAGVSAYSGWVGQASCGCFGSVTVHPWYTFTTDLMVILVLFLCRPEWARSSQDVPALTRNQFPSAVYGITAALCTGIIALGAMYLWFGSPSEALAHLRGESLTISPSVVDLSKVEAGSQSEIAVEVTNRMDRPIRIIGGSSTCTCVSTGSLPVTLDPRQTRILKLVVRFPNSTGWFTQTARLWISDEDDAARGTGEIVLPIHAHIWCP